MKSDNHLPILKKYLPNAFSLIELMVVVAILSVAAAILVPRFLKHETERRQAECHKNLKALFEAEREYHQKNGVYTDDLATLGWKPDGKGLYDYQLLPTPSGFRFECQGNIDKDPTLDHATIDEGGQIHQESDDTKS